MGFLKWYKRDPNAALRGMMNLTLEERGAYNTILDLIYAHDGALEDSPQDICRALRCNIRTWRRLKARLLELGKVYVYAGCLRNQRADDEIRNAQSLAKLSGVNARKRWAAYNEIKKLQHGVAMRIQSKEKKELSANVVPIKRTSDKKSQKPPTKDNNE